MVARYQTLTGKFEGINRKQTMTAEPTQALDTMDLGRPGAALLASLPEVLQCHGQGRKCSLGTSQTLSDI